MNFQLFDHFENMIFLIYLKDIYSRNLDLFIIFFEFQNKFDK